jgi:hypothetical protein
MWQFENVDTIGSLLKVTPEECAAIRVDSGIFGQKQELLKTQAEYLSRSYHCVVTNPPYLGKGFSDELKDYVTAQFPNSKSDLYAAFIERIPQFVASFGYTGMVTMESWMFLSSYEKLRQYILERQTILSLSHFGWHIMRIAFGTVAFILQNKKYAKELGVYSYLATDDVDLDAELPYVFPNKSNGRYTITYQSQFENIPGSPISYWASDGVIKAFNRSTELNENLDCLQGIITGDTGRYIKNWFEISQCKLLVNSESFDGTKYWVSYTKGGSYRRWYGNNDYVLYWVDKGEYLVRNRSTNAKYYLKPCFTWTLIGAGKFSTRYCPKGFLWDVAGSIGVPKIKEWEYLLGFMNSHIAEKCLKILNPTINTNIEDIESLPIISSKFSNELSIKSVVSDCISISKQDWDAHETSWDFEKNELLTFDAGNIVQRLNQYKQKWEHLFLQLHSNEEELNRQFIEIYGLQDELTPDVPLNEITILQKGEISIEDNQILWHDDVIIKQFISYLVGCFMGRYSVDRPGLIIASQGQDLRELGLQVDGLEGCPQSTLCIDDDGIVPIVQEEDFFADDMTQRVESAIRKLFGDEAFYENMKFIKNTLGCSLRDYFYKDFYNDHLQMYSVKGAKRPIYWLFSSKMGDKRKKGYFKALVYMHRMAPDTLSKLHADYVHPYVNNIERILAEAEDQASRDDLSQAQRNKALKWADEMREKVKEVHAFEQQLVEMASHRLSIDLDDGVKANYPKYYPLVEPIKGLDSSNED